MTDQKIEIFSVNLKPDCSACASLCCVVFAFEKSDDFAVDKAAGESCPNLLETGLCSIFDKREAIGFKGCITYDCLGAGQRVTNEIFGAASWRENPALTRRMGDALSKLRRIHEQIALLSAAERLPLSPVERDRVAAFAGKLMPAEKWTEAALSAFPVKQVSDEVSAFLQSLKQYVEEYRPSGHS